MLHPYSMYTLPCVLEIFISVVIGTQAIGVSCSIDPYTSDQWAHLHVFMFHLFFLPIYVHAPQV